MDEVERENYVCKYVEEIQSVHFVGGQQITLYTGVLYFKDVAGNQRSKSFCTASESLWHDAAAVWAHIHPIIEQHLQEYPAITSTHGLSDSPTNQYRNKTMFTILRKILKGFPTIKELTWIYTEAGHGKGAPDTVIKRFADRLLAQGKDIENFKKLVKNLKLEVKGVFIHTVNLKIMESLDRYLSQVEKPFQGITSPPIVVDKPKSEKKKRISED
ncbi:hypothetical protein AVEN_23015-1 [Araneus ventricosus]|uniref:Uncharacterized protein n=1 Tax=Araneus ventricosus TaxID=182803 RepID=A0A4Y2LK98_ARAVE|nr:hypothetical protein AVEN_23015-1 [Araneus ventricosus]